MTTSASTCGNLHQPAAGLNARPSIRRMPFFAGERAASQILHARN